MLTIIIEKGKSLKHVFIYERDLKRISRDNYSLYIEFAGFYEEIEVGFEKAKLIDNIKLNQICHLIASLIDGNEVISKVGLTKKILDIIYKEQTND